LASGAKVGPLLFVIEQTSANGAVRSFGHRAEEGENAKAVFSQ
jgi:hypothetical protein